MIDLVDELVMGAGLVIALAGGDLLLGAGVFVAGAVLHVFIHGGL